MSEPPRFDAYTGQPLEPRFDPLTGRPLTTLPAATASPVAAREALALLPAGTQLATPARRLGAYALDGLLAIVTLGIGWFVWFLIVMGRGQSPAKQLLGLRVVKASEGRVASWWRMALREIVCKTVIGVLGATVIGLVFYFWLLWDKHNQELWDKMADTIVVHDPRSASSR